ncbi:MAG: 2,3-bisphosphoglycerate-independent phosphoglycerate mutase, partial [Arenimonas sp.]|nr:2,3-bisphosphoglycerate-independent phosphoglycerate mutase [Arenimonas sp.]
MGVKVLKPVVLLILDGWGYRAETADNAIALADLPNWHKMLAECPYTLIHTEGRFVGLPDGQMGNSEVGHMNIGAGRIVYQDLTRIDAAIEDGSFNDNEALLSAIEAVKRNGKTLHVMGLLSPGGVHSHEQHLFAFLRLAKLHGVSRVQVHAFLDGRDMPPRSAKPSLLSLQALCLELAQTTIASVTGRYYAMDRDSRWERMLPAYQAIAQARSEHAAATAVEALDAAYARGENDEFVLPTVIAPSVAMADGDAVVFMNFRADRARQLVACLINEDFDGFDRETRPQFSEFVCLSEYDANLKAQVAFASQELPNTLADVLSAHQLKQLRIAETEKYAHVTFFFNGGLEMPVAGEDRILIPS